MVTFSFAPKEEVVGQICPTTIENPLTDEIIIKEGEVITEEVYSAIINLLMDLFSE